MALVMGPPSTCGHDLEIIEDGTFHLEEISLMGRFTF
jgi:hypothetical protein